MPASTALEGPLEAHPSAAPVISVVEGVRFITVPLAHYQSLLGTVADPAPPTPAAPTRGERRAYRLSRLDKDREVRAFITERIGTEDVQAIREAAIRRFGAARVPGRTAVADFARRVRREADARV